MPPNPSPRPARAAADLTADRVELIAPPPGGAPTRSALPALVRWARQVRDRARQRTLPLPPRQMTADRANDQAAQATDEQRAG